MSMHLEENNDKDSSGTDVLEDEPVSSELGVNEDHPPEEEEDKSESSSESSDRFASCVVEDSLEANGTDDDNENEDSPTCEGINLSLSNQEIDSGENADLKANNMSAVSESEQQAAKRPRFTRSLLKDLHR
uniref:Putative Cysteine proteinases superfamily protein isoform 3 n=1 Tax=Davidia involucrata TaxID=16924 RepID=A0A5B7AML4_DAVIN